MLTAALLMTGHFIAHTVTVDGAERRYQVWLPAAYDASRRWPVILFLHGAGERGSDGIAQTTVGLGHALREGKVDPPAIVVFPQCPADSHWVGAARRIAVAALEQVIESYSVDEHRRVEARDGVEAGESRQLEVEHDHFRLRTRGQRLLGRREDADHVDIERRHQPFAHHRVIVHDRDARHRRFCFTSHSITPVVSYAGSHELCFTPGNSV